MTEHNARYEAARLQPVATAIFGLQARGTHSEPAAVSRCELTKFSDFPVFNGAFRVANAWQPSGCRAVFDRGMDEQGTVQ